MQTLAGDNVVDYKCWTTVWIELWWRTAEIWWQITLDFLNFNIAAVVYVGNN
jgi:hypothetical protein